ncbi:MAG: GNAT family N-acetyltransferase [Paracoccaceae bacterium]|nr:GNAT family N-acetyltransferase [Paracoccaceae bacterium]
MADSEEMLDNALKGRISIRRARAEDLDQVIALDAKVTGLAKLDYWQDIFERYATRRLDERFFLVAEGSESDAGTILGFIIGEVRGWEFGSAPCGWVFAFSVDPGTRLRGVGESLFEAISDRFRAAGIRTMRTMVARDNRLHMAFFRSEGMVAGPYIQLEKSLDD